jgi:hypothetical protein
MSEPEELNEQPPIRVWRRVWIALGVLAGILLTIGVVRHFNDDSFKHLKKVQAELTESDPNWRLEALERSRPQVEEEQNSARVIVNARRLVPKDWGKMDMALDEKLRPPNDLWERPPPARLDDEQQAALEKMLAPVAGALAEARKLANMPTGRHPLTLAVNPIGTLLPTQQEARMTASLLRYDALLRAQKGDIAGGLESCRGILNSGRSLGDEPFLVSGLIRIACVAIACNMAERVLAQGEASDADLAALQKLLALEDRHPTLAIGMRGERAVMDDLFTKMANGTIKSKELNQMIPHGDLPEGVSWRIRLLGFSTSDIQRDHALMLKTMNKWLEITKLPESEQAAAERKLHAEIRSMVRDAILFRLLVPAVTKVAEACRRNTATLRTAMTMLAVERYRLKKGKWPEKLDDLKPDFLAAVPNDPFDGKPLRYVKRADGVTVYSVGHDGKDDGGKIDRTKPLGPGVDLGYRLWDVKARRQAPLPRPAPPGGDPGDPGK